MIRRRFLKGAPLACSLFFVLWSTAALALDPEEVVVIANREVPEGVRLASYYMEKRGVPEEHLLLVRAAEGEVCRRREYERGIAAPVRRFLEGLGSGVRIRCLVLMYGMPLKIDPQEEAGEGTRSKWASVDSEIALVLWKTPYPLAGWVENPYFLGFRDREDDIGREAVLMVSRLDGPDPSVARRIIDDAIWAEAEGLNGRACFDARWAEPPEAEREVSGYALYDRSIHRAAAQVRESGILDVTLDEAQPLFQAGDCPNTALYCGWYSLAAYVDAFTWARGAVGYHIASGECKTLKREGSRVWCKRILEDGACATLGPVGEPYVNAFPLPEIFFRFLVDGYLTLAECYLVSLPYLSWKMVLIGDPLYRPFASVVKEKRDRFSPKTRPTVFPDPPKGGTDG